MCTAPTAPHARYMARRLGSAGTARLFLCVRTRRLQVLPREAVITRHTPCGCLPAPRGCGHPPWTAGAFLRPSAPSPPGATASRQSHGCETGGTSPGRSHGGRRRPSRHAALLRTALPALGYHAPLTGSVFRAVSGVLGVPAGQLPGCRAGGGGCCRSSAGCVSRASCRSRM